MVLEVAAAVSEKPTASSEHRVTGRTDASAPEVPMPAQKAANGHLKFFGVAGHPTHTQQHLQAIQEHKDQILSP